MPVCIVDTGETGHENRTFQYAECVGGWFRRYPTCITMNKAKHPPILFRSGKASDRRDRKKLKPADVTLKSHRKNDNGGIIGTCRREGVDSSQSAWHQCVWFLFEMNLDHN